MNASAASAPWILVARVLVASWGRRYRGILVAIAALAAIALGLSLAGDRSSAQILFGQIMLFSPVIAGLLTMSGIVSDERESGLIVMWFQKPGSLFRTYFVRY